MRHIGFCYRAAAKWPEIFHWVAQALQGSPRECPDAVPKPSPQLEGSWDSLCNIHYRYPDLEWLLGIDSSRCYAHLDLTSKEVLRPGYPSPPYRDKTLH